MNWNTVRRLDLEIANICNAACPQCTRHPTGSDMLHPILETKHRWTLEDTIKYFPPEDLGNIDSFLFNGNFGDFISNNEALEIITYFSSVRPSAYYHICTNGSARPKSWWRELAKIKNLKITFGIDGLEDTHHLYRRNTDFNTIIENAKTFIEAGGQAEWTMTLFEHNKHQVKECNTLANNIGFISFVPRHTNRGTTLVSEKKKPLYVITPANEINIDHDVKNSVDIERIIKLEESIQSGNFVPRQFNECIPLNSKSECMSVKDNSIYVGADWFVSPCCYSGPLGYNNKFNPLYNDFIQKIAEENLKYTDFFVSEGKTVKDAVNFSWIFDRLTTNDILAVCTKHCHKKVSLIQQAIVENKNINATYYQ